MTADSSYSLQALERRWQLEKTPQVGLRLAEEYRRKGELDRSIEALAAGLEVYPSHTASRVALSRYLVDAERFSEAVEHLERIVSVDPAHLVANKLLVGAYAGVGRIDDARDKLAIYEMMGEGDADIERLQALLEGGGDRVDSASGAPMQTAEDHVGAGPGRVAEPQPEVLEDTFGERGDPGTDSTGPAMTGDDELAPGTRGAEPEAEAPVSGPTGPVDEDADPFRPFPETPAAAAPSAVPPPADATDAMASAAAGDEPFGEAFEAVPSSTYWQGVADEGIFVFESPLERPQPPSPPAGEEAEAAAAPPVFETEEIPSVSEAAQSPADAAAPSQPSSGDDSVSEATLTLGRLYLEQGHREQAAEVFEQVLAREPDNQEARRELEAAARPEVDAAVDAAVDVDVAASAETLADRRRAVLISYRNRLRQAVAAGI